jgi:glycosyltransferase involved in cell wall biosynthesis
MADLYGYSIGSTIKALKLFGALEKRGHTVQLHWLVKQNASTQYGVPASAKKNVVKYFARILLFTPKYLLKNVPQFFREIKILKSENADMLIVRLDAFRISAVWAARLYHLPLIIEADGASSYEWLTFNNGRHLWSWALLWCERLMLSRSQGIFTQSTEAKEYFCQRHNIEPEKIAVITNGADIVNLNDAPDSELQNQLGIKKTDNVVGFIGSMHHWHGVADVPQLIDRVLAEFENTVFLFVGKGGALENDLHQSLSKKYSDRVIFTGHVDNERAPDYIRLFTVAIAPYPKIDLFYFSPMKVFEYMAAGKAIIASRIGQIKEVIQDGENGVLCEPGNIADLQTKLIELLKDQPRQRKLGEKVVQSFLDNYTWAIKARELEKYLQR